MRQMEATRRSHVGPAHQHGGRGRTRHAFDHIVTRSTARHLAQRSRCAAGRIAGLTARDCAIVVMRSPVIGVAIAATLVLAVGGVYLSQRAPVEPRPRAATRLHRWKADDGLQRDGVANFVWTPLAEATRYKIEVFSKTVVRSGRASHSADHSGWRIATREGAYRWRVEAVNGADVIARSRLALSYRGDDVARRHWRRCWRA